MTFRKYRWFIIVAFILWTLWFFGLGALGSYFLSKSRLAKLPDLSSSDRLLILAPHIDDEIISSAGLIQQAQQIGCPLKIVYFTNGDNNLVSIIEKNKIIKTDPNEFIQLGEKRMAEAKKATSLLGLTRDNLIFLGFPDEGLLAMLSTYYNDNNPSTSQGTKFTYNPYSNTYKTEQLYAGSNVVADLTEIINDFKPTIIIVSHPRDKHLDHQAAFRFLEKTLSKVNFKVHVFSYLVHYPLFPPAKKLLMNDFLYPPKKLFSQKGWYSLDLSSEQENKKLEAIKQNSSQLGIPHLYDLLLSFVKRNEIFEEME